MFGRPAMIGHEQPVSWIRLLWREALLRRASRATETKENEAMTTLEFQEMPIGWTIVVWCGLVRLAI
jgi:hypothetical protein